MCHDLYFVALLCTGLAAADTRDGLRRSLQDIVRLGRQKSHARGYRLFLRFLATVRAEAEWMSHGQPTALFARPPLAAIHTAMATPLSTQIRIERGDDLLGACGLAELPFTAHHITPGPYRILLDTGWVLWEGHLQAHQLTWTGAFGDRPLEAAASTGETPWSATYRQPLLGGLLELTLTPGLESGTLTLRRR